MWPLTYYATPPLTFTFGPECSRGDPVPDALAFPRAQRAVVVHLHPPDHPVPLDPLWHIVLMLVLVLVLVLVEIALGRARPPFLSDHG